MTSTDASTAYRPDDSVYFTTVKPPALAVYNQADTLAYLARISLPASTIDQPPSFDLLRTLTLAQHLSIPYDSTSLHVAPSAWSGPSKPIVLGQGPGMELGRGNFERIVNRGTGGYCYSANTALAAFLRGFGFKVSECGARVYLFRGGNPEKVGWDWSCITHEVLVVHWDGLEEGKRYLLDAGFGGGGIPFPIELKDGATSLSLSKGEAFLVKAEKLPQNDGSIFHADTVPGFTLYRRVLPKGEVVGPLKTVHEAPGHWSPLYHFVKATMCPADITMANYFNEKHPNAAFVNFFVTSLLLPSGARRTLAYGNAPTDMKSNEGGDPKKAKLYTKEGINGDEVDVQYFEFATGPIGEVLRREFGFKI